ncbi:MAG: MBL fold metallo-hydrolase, partial [Lacipirellulaceae bacterium]
MFHWDHGLFLSRPRLALDVTRQQPHGFISHAHHDHMARHELAYCTPSTGKLYRHRLGAGRQVVELAEGVPREYSDVRLTTYPAGHCLGSVMLHMEGLGLSGKHSEDVSLLYTGDFKLGESATAARANPPQADILLMECTFGDPRYCFPPREVATQQLVKLTRMILKNGETPVVHAYELGKAQEVTKILTEAGIPVLQHPAIFAVSKIYENEGVNLGDVAEYRPELLPGRVVITLPKSSPGFRLAGIELPVSIAVTGWAMDATLASRWQADHAVPLSDHADFN